MDNDEHIKAKIDTVTITNTEVYDIMTKGRKYVYAATFEVKSPKDLELLTKMQNTPTICHYCKKEIKDALCYAALIEEKTRTWCGPCNEKHVSYE